LSLSDIKSKFKSTFEDLFGRNLTATIFGTDQIEVPGLKLPVIPKLNNSATDTSIYKIKTIDTKKTKFDSLKQFEKNKFRASFLNELFFVTSKMKLSKDNLSVYIDRFNQGVSREGIYRSIVSDKDYYELERTPVVSSDRLIKFTVLFTPKYLNTDFKEGSLRNSNRYVIKRIVTDKALDVAEALSTKPDDLYRWYAILSAELSTYPVWNNKTRMNISENYHYDWAKRAPFSHIKSEIIIKLHKIYNYL
jgi:hypothetical protein